jgi:hypothetical protein
MTIAKTATDVLKYPCSSLQFNAGSFFKGKETQCFCEQEPEYQPYRCAEENEECQCSEGNQVFYMRKYAEKAEDT